MLYIPAMLFGNTPAQIQKDPSVLTRFIADLFGYIIDFMFNIVYTLTVNHSLGLAIILLTVVVRALMLPLAVKSQKSMLAMQKLAPEAEKIRAKYNAPTDPEIKQKMNMEIQTLYTKNGVNPLGGCLPLLIQMPFFFGLMYIMNQSYLYIAKLKDLYFTLSAQIIAVPHFTRYVNDIAIPHVPVKMLETGAVDVSLVEHMAKIINKFSVADWDTLFSRIPAEYMPGILEVFNKKQAVELFAGLNLIESAGWAWPGVLIPVLAGGTTLLSSWLSQQMTAAPNPQMKTQQTVMMVVMPVFMAFITVGMPAGVGVYWITSSVFQVAQQLVMNQRAGLPLFKRKT